ncbi:hypothetical protein RIF29_21823 [Crotalaria pallida]|uniref:Uncharacterized protein n=1 Tax=Crotalaria pallida TaxID=3830 RepID=A0AAN9I7I7_CROPI
MWTGYLSSSSQCMDYLVCYEKIICVALLFIKDGRENDLQASRHRQRYHRTPQHPGGGEGSVTKEKGDYAAAVRAWLQGGRDSRLGGEEERGVAATHDFPGREMEA